MQQFVVRGEIPSNYAEDDDDICDKNMEDCNYSLHLSQTYNDHNHFSPTSHINKTPTWSPDLRTPGLYGGAEARES